MSISFVWQVGSVDLVIDSRNYTREDQEASITDEMSFDYAIVNNGLLTLYNIGLDTKGFVTVGCATEDSADAEIITVDGGSVGGLATYVRDHGLAPGGELKCQATGGVSRAEVSLQKCCQGDRPCTV